jgi:3-hydroxyacyl-CoA dehydrogenase
MMEIKKVCVLGAGLMGSGIAQVCAQAGYQVTRSPSAVKKRRKKGKAIQNTCVPDIT